MRSTSQDNRGRGHKSGPRTALGPLLALAGLLSMATPLAAYHLATSASRPLPAQPAPMDNREATEFFEKKVRPLLIAECFSCHSAQSKPPMGGLRLDSRAEMLKGGGRGAAVVPGKPDTSLLLHAVEYADKGLLMPPKGKLSAEKIAILAEWVKQGAVWPASPAAKPGKAAGVSGGVRPFDLKERAKHWAWQPVRKPALPTVAHKNWPRTPIDYFLLAELEKRGLAPAPPTDKRTLLRRVTYDLIGLPSTPQEIAAFLADNSPNAYEKVVDRLLASPHYGERWARHWMDLVRYAETNGHEWDYEKAGAYQYRDYLIRAFNADLPYNQFVSEHVAGDLLSNPRMNPSAGFDESVLGTAFYWLGAGQHSPVDLVQDQSDHIDNQIDVFGKTFLGMGISCARCHDHKFDAIRTQDYYALYGFLKSTRQQIASVTPPLRETVRRELQSLSDELSQALPSSQNDPRKAHEPQGAGEVEWLDDYRLWKADGDAFHNANGTVCADSGRLAGRLGGVLRSPTFTITKPRLIYRLAGQRGQVRLIINGFQLIQDPLYGGLQFPVQSPDQWKWRAQDVSMWKGHRAYIELVDGGEGWIAATGIGQADNSPVESIEPVDNGFRLLHTAQAGETSDHAIAKRLARKQELEQHIALPQPALAATDGTGENERIHVRGNYKTPGPEAPRRFLEACDRGKPLPTGDGSGRLALVQRMTDPTNPLLARVFVNRVWQHHFGEGLVRTPDDFGIMGQRPTNPALLDWLAATFVASRESRVESRENGVPSLSTLDSRLSTPSGLSWSLKRLHRLLVLSSAYRMDSRSTIAADKADPQNKLLHRMPVRRLEAECVRDGILAVSGRLDPTLYGAPIMPNLTAFTPGRGAPPSGPVDGAGRRSIYLSVRRNFPVPLLVAFDMPVPASTMGRRTVSNVPAQALALLNNPFVVEQAAVWAKRIRQSPASEAEKIVGMYEMAFGRLPTKSEQETAASFLAEQGRRYGNAGDERAWADLCHVLFNLKEFLFVR